MTTSSHVIMVLFSGGETPGMNPFLQALTGLGINRHQAVVLGCRDGFNGLIRLANAFDSGAESLASIYTEIELRPGCEGLAEPLQQIVRLDHPSVHGLVSRPGVLLGAGRAPEFRNPLVRRRVIALLEALGVTACVVCGGAGSLEGAARLAEESRLTVVGVPATVDNDVAATEMSLGEDTAVNTLIGWIEKLAAQSEAEQGVFVLEVLGRSIGELSRLGASASGAEIVVAPPRDELSAGTFREMVARLEYAMLYGTRHGMVLVPEGDPTLDPGAHRPVIHLAQALQAQFRRRGSRFPDAVVRVEAVAPLQRDGSPSAADRILATRFADVCWRGIVERHGRGSMLGLQGNRVVLMPFGELKYPDPQGFLVFGHQNLQQIIHDAAPPPSGEPQAVTADPRHRVLPWPTSRFRTN